MKKALFLASSLCLLALPLWAQQSPISTKTYESISNKIKVKGDAQQEGSGGEMLYYGWADATGEYTFVRSLQAGSDGKMQVLFSAFNNKDGKQLWSFSENQTKGCPVLLMPNSFQVMDLDKDGAAEVFFTHYGHCGDPELTPETFRFALTLVSKGKAYYVKGKASSDGVDETYGPEFKEAPISFRGMAERIMAEFTETGQAYSLRIAEEGLGFWLVEYSGNFASNGSKFKLLNNKTAEPIETPEQLETAKWYEVQKSQIVYLHTSGLYVFNASNRKNQQLHALSDISGISSVAKSPSGKRWAFATPGAIHVLEMDGLKVKSSKRYEVTVHLIPASDLYVSDVQFKDENTLAYIGMDDEMQAVEDQELSLEED
jgi:hypothetical protein